MRTLLTIRVGSVLFCLANVLLGALLTAAYVRFPGYTYAYRQFIGTDKSRQPNEESVWKFPSVYQLLKGLNIVKQMASSDNSTTFKHANRKALNVPRRHPKIFNNVFSDRKKSIHEFLHKILNARVHFRQDNQPSTTFKSRDSSEKKGSFRISDEPVKGRGEYTISPDQKDVGIKLKLRINVKQQQQQQKQYKQQLQPRPTITTIPKLVQSRSTRQMCLAPCNTTRKPPAANCIPSRFEQEALGIHNRYRAIHNAPAMTLNCEMSKNAAEYAQTLADMDTLVQSGYTERPDQGENLSLGCYENRQQTAEEAVKTWFDEVCQYTFGKQGPQSGTNHFTQLVWKESTELGIGKAFNKQPNGATCTFIVARYKPQGNFESDNDAYVKNIEKGSFDESYCRNIKKAGLDGGYGFKRFQNH